MTAVLEAPTAVRSPLAAPTGPRQSRIRIAPSLLASALLAVVAVGSLGVGRLSIPATEIVRLLLDQGLTALPFLPDHPIRQTWTAQEASVILNVRLPRVLLAFVVGGALSLGGACMQGVFRNPLVSPDIAGVTAGASFGGVLALFLGAGGVVLVTGSFAFGVGALALVLALAGLGRGERTLMLVLGGIVVAAFFNALVSFITYIADPQSELPSIVHWLMGSLASASYAKLAIATVPIAIGSVVVLLMRWRLNVLTLGDDDAAALGIDPTRSRLALLGAVALMTAGTVAVAGSVGWVGLLVPHLARLWGGPDHRTLLPLSLLLGGSYLIVIDTLSRSVTSSEIPLGILTAIVGAPVFVGLLAHTRKKEANDELD